MGLYAIKPKFQQALNPIKELFIFLHISPTQINILALLFSMLGGLAFYYADKIPSLLLLIPIVAFIRIALNALDGMVARQTNAANQQFGEVLNETLDRLSDIFFFSGFALASFTPTNLSFGVLLLILLNSYLSIVSKAAGGSRQYGGLMGKADRMFWLGAFAIIYFLMQDVLFVHILLGILYVGIIQTLILRFFKTRRELYE